jgi:hypothetical protein
LIVVLSFCHRILLYQPKNYYQAILTNRHMLLKHPVMTKLHGGTSSNNNKNSHNSTGGPTVEEVD